MADGTDRTFSAALRGAGASQMTLGGIDLLRSGLIKGVDIYLEAGQSPQVVIRPILLDQVTVDLTAGDLDGKAPRCVVAPDVAFLLEELGWASPETVEDLEGTLADAQAKHLDALQRVQEVHRKVEELDRAHFSCGDKLVTLEQGQAYWEARHEEARNRITVLEREAVALQERITAQESELETAAQAVETALTEKAQMAEELANVNGHLEDLKLANATLLAELESAQAEAVSAGKHPYDPAA